MNHNTLKRLIQIIMFLDQTANSQKRRPSSGRQSVCLKSLPQNSLQSSINESYPQSSERVANETRTLNNLFDDQSLIMEIRDLILTNRFPDSCLATARMSDLSTSLDHLWTLDSSKLSEIEATLVAFGRPTIPITGDNVHSTHSEIINARLQYQPQKLSSAIKRVGLIKNTSEATTQKRLCGTAWFVSPNTIATTKNVALKMMEDQTSGFRTAHGKPLVSWEIEMENDTSSTSKIKIVKTLFASEKEEFALFQTSENLALDFRELNLEHKNYKGSSVAIISYDCSSNEKVLIPGKILKEGEMTFYHDCPMEGVVEGGLIINLSTGDIIGTHIAGNKETDYRATSLSPVLRRLKKLP